MDHSELIADLRARRIELMARAKAHIEATRAATRENDTTAERSRGTIKRSMDTLGRIGEKLSGARDPFASALASQSPSASQQNRTRSRSR